MSFRPGPVYCFATAIDAAKYTSAIKVPLIIAVHDVDTTDWRRDPEAGGAWRLALAVSTMMRRHEVITSVQRDEREATFFFSGRGVAGAFCITIRLHDAADGLADDLVSTALEALRADARSAFVRQRCI